MLFGRITGMMMVVILYLIFIGGFIVSLSVSINGFDLFTTITQTVFSAEIVVGTIKMLAYHFGLGKIEYEFYCNLINNKAQTKKKLGVLLLDIIMDYECLKSYCQITTSEGIFKKYNKHWPEEWSRLYKET